MRISTVTMFESSLRSMNRQQSEFLKVGQQIATGKKVINPSDDPRAASQALSIKQSMAVTQQYMEARTSARNTLSQSESVLSSVGDAVASARTLLIQAGNDTLSEADRQSVAAELRGIYETLVGQANATDGNGRYLFGGYQDSAPPFQRVDAGDGSVPGVTYVGDDNSRAQRIDAFRDMPVGDNGDSIFRRVPSGSGVVARAEQPDGSRNNGSVVFTAGPNRADANDVNFGSAFAIVFSEDPITGEPLISAATSDGDVLLTDEPFVPGQPIQLAGVSMTLDGRPADGDQIQVRPANHPDATQDMFKSLKDAIDVLELDQQGSDENRAHFRNTLNTTLRELDNNLDNVLTVRASMGARLNELDVVDGVAVNRMLNYQQTLSGLVDLDYAEAISEYSLRQVGLQAAQQSFVDIKGLSLFDFLR